VNLIKAVLALVFAGSLGTLAFIYSGLFNPAADEPHSKPFHWLLETVRERGIATRVDDAVAPDLKEPALIRAGAGNYDAMCIGCHLKPGLNDSEIHRGLYPQPPAFGMGGNPVEPRRAFWIIKHGIKASGMPAWGKSMDDRSIWGMVAFLQTLPRLSPGDYHEAVEASGGHSHSGAEPQGMDHHDDGEIHAHHHDDGHDPMKAPELGNEAASAAHKQTP